MRAGLIPALLAASFATSAMAQAPDPHAGHQMPAAPPPPAAPQAADRPPPPVAKDYLADEAYGAAVMARARETLAVEHGGMRVSKTMIDQLEIRPGSAGDAYAWEGAFRYGGDMNKLVLKSEGEGEIDHHLESAEVQALYSRALGPYFDLQAGVRQDFEPRPRRTYATLGLEGLAPYWFEVGGALFLSNKGELSARLQGEYDLRLTQRLVLQPSTELNLSAGKVAELGLGAGLTSAEVGLRLRYEIRREFAPYIGVNFERKLGETGDLAKAAGERREDTRFVIGLRAWF